MTSFGGPESRQSQARAGFGLVMALGTIRGCSSNVLRGTGFVAAAALATPAFVWLFEPGGAGAVVSALLCGAFGYLGADLAISGDEPVRYDRVDGYVP